MSDAELRELMQKFWRLPDARFADELRFDATLKGFSSVRFLTFLAAVEERAKKRVGDPTTLVTYRKLREALGAAASGAGALAVGAAPATGPAPGGRAAPRLTLDAPGLRLGHDIELVESMPRVSDFAGDAFYRRCFTPGEIAYCVAQAEPRMHFAARFAAKEALQKCDPVLQKVAMSAIEIVASDGRPRIELHDGEARRALGGARIAVSLSHTEMLASAVVVIS
jgi:holo-[acyl-carrier protein] synthase